MAEAVNGGLADVVQRLLRQEAALFQIASLAYQPFETRIRELVRVDAFTLTVAIFRRARRLSIHVPGPRKAEAVKATIENPVSTACPATILRLHPDATLFVDIAAAKLLRS